MDRDAPESGNKITVTKRYNAVAVLLHWSMASGFFLMLGSGFALEYLEMDKSFKFQLFQWHKSGGVLLLIAFCLRVIWRLLHKPPTLPDYIKGMEKHMVHIGHFVLYALMFVMPFSGWVMVSSSDFGLPTIVFGLFEWPHIPNIQGNEAINGASKQAHFILAILFAVTVLGHFGAVIKHAVIDRDNLLHRMTFPLKKVKRKLEEGLDDA